MVGAIRKREVLAHPIVTIQCFGWQVFFRALLAGRNQTFLSLLAESGAMQAPTDPVHELIERCVELELAAETIYDRLGQQFAGSAEAATFFRTLARQEQSHAELLRLCKAAATNSGWAEEQLGPSRGVLPQLEQDMDSARTTLPSVTDLAAAFRLVIQIESSEINTVFRRVVAATESDFVKKLQAFQTAGSQHVGYICREISRLRPELAQDCQRIR